MSVRAFLLHHPLFWGLILTPATLFVHTFFPTSQILSFVLSLFAIIPLAALLSHSTEQIAERLGNAPGGLLSATMGNITELIIGLTALHAGLFDLVKAALAGAVITNGLCTLGISFLAGGFKHHIQKLNLDYVHLHAGSLLLAAIALLVPSVLQELPNPNVLPAVQPISLALSIVLIVVYLLGLLFTLVTHNEIFNRQKKVAPRQFNGMPLAAYISAMLI
ncbi:MAG TPA: hypothetical protein VFM46_16655, partial [Pseudomonadales bacterium]|nr:hypothetical protein [Pseudomonadales bacterium]